MITKIALKVKGCEAVGVNERLRFLRYDPVQKFEPHFDGSYYRPDGVERTLFTVQLYLNEGYGGGATTLINFKTKYAEDKVEVKTKTGSVLIFQHHVFHEGSPLMEGRKYTMRSDVFYKPLPKE